MWRVGAALLLGIVAACGPARPPEVNRDPLDTGYRGVDTQLLEGDLVRFFVEIEGPTSEAALTDYADCAAAQYALIRDYGFARHVRTTIDERGGVWRADAVYTISRTLPNGRRTIDAEVVLAECTESGIPAV